MSKQDAQAPRYSDWFDTFATLAQEVPWTNGLSSTVEWLTWDTRGVLGISKTDYWKLVLKWAAEVDHADLDGRIQHVRKRLEHELFETRASKIDEPPKKGPVSPTEALRRARVYSEDYLNKEFDICWSLASDAYLDEFYRQFTTIAGGGKWFTIGNSTLFQASTGIGDMQMDSLAYNPSEGVLVANELKLNGVKNPDQMLKYALMFRELKMRGFIEGNSRLLLLFIGDRLIEGTWESLLRQEIEYCKEPRKRRSASTARAVEEAVPDAESAEFGTTTWDDLIHFNQGYLSKLSSEQSTEAKLLRGFTRSLREKIGVGRT